MKINADSTTIQHLYHHSHSRQRSTWSFYSINLDSCSSLATAEEKAGTYHAELYRGSNFLTSAMRNPWKVLNRSLVPGEMAKNGRGTTVELELELELELEQLGGY